MAGARWGAVGWRGKADGRSEGAPLRPAASLPAADVSHLHCTSPPPCHLQASFPYIGIADLRAVPLAVLDRLHPVPATFLKQVCPRGGDGAVGEAGVVGGDRDGMGPLLWAAGLAHMASLSLHPLALHHSNPCALP